MKISEKQINELILMTTQLCTLISNVETSLFLKEIGEIVMEKIVEITIQQSDEIKEIE